MITIHKKASVLHREIRKVVKRYLLGLSGQRYLLRAGSEVA